MSSFVRLRPSLSSQTNPCFRFSSHRKFHASPRSQFIDPALLLSSTHDFLNLIHSSTGLPWGATLPLLALIMRASVILPFSIYSRRKLQKTAEMVPLLQAWQHQASRSIMKANPYDTPGSVEKQVQRATRLKRAELRKRNGTQMWKIYLPPMLQVPIWLVVMETLRGMSGMSKGLFASIALPNAMKVATSDAWTAVGDKLPSMTLVQGSDGTDLLASGISRIGMDPSLAIEGVLWFPNLLMPDPYLWPLPLLLSSVMVLNIIKSPRSLRESYNNLSIGQKRVYRGLIAIAVLIGPALSSFPSAILVYWVSSASLGFIQNTLLERFMPIRPKIMPCKHRGIMPR